MALAGHAKDAVGATCLEAGLGWRDSPWWPLVLGRSARREIAVGDVQLAAWLALAGEPEFPAAALRERIGEASVARRGKTPR